MTEIRFTRDYRGKLTQELFYEADTVAEFGDSIALQIVAEGAAEIVKKPKPQPAPAKSTRSKSTSTRAK